MTGLARTADDAETLESSAGGAAPAPLHVCFLCGEYPPGRHGGVGSFTQTLGRALAARGHRVTVVGVYPRRDTVEDDDAGVRVVRLAHTRVRGLGFLIHGARIRRVLAAIHRQHPIDVIEGPELSLALLDRQHSASRVIRMNGGHHFFMTSLGTPLSPWRCWLEKRSFQRADTLCAVSRFVAERTRTLLELGPRPIEILPNPVNTAHFSPRPEIAEEDGLIVFVGTVCEKKGVRQLVAAMPRVLSQVPEAKLEIIGPDLIDARTGQSYVAQLRAQMPAGVEPSIIFRGAVANAELPSVLARASVCVYPSHMEALPVAWLEGMAMGKAIVASRKGPGPELVEDGTSGLLCDPHDPASIAEAILKLLGDRSLRTSLGAQARRRAVENHSDEVLVERNIAFYRRCVQHARSR